MADKAIGNMETAGINNVEVRCGHSDNFPFRDNFFDVVASNGIYNLSPDKEKVMREVYRVLRARGRTVFCEVVLKDKLPKELRKNIDDWFRCIGGALPETEFIALKLYQELGMPEQAISSPFVPISAPINYKNGIRPQLKKGNHYAARHPDRKRKYLSCF
jgi:ubiquinone/menaquinone biosynthesis C-methylase UbiE